ncbi:hypothetical protein Glove_91g68 [Diversispora epigaea]|uniref:Uncharacterized protein n=1 Tax=Diversispora epigaea TaxID=1348612 RepID=A0A397J9Q5_9GLOM|nr:hypothetical protein Glove_91g68 [Diversispora epigaea]
MHYARWIDEPISEWDVENKDDIKKLNYVSWKCIINHPKPKNEENFERELEELTKSMSDPGDSGIIDLDISNF